MFHTFSLKVNVEFFDSIKPWLKSDDEVQFLVMCTGAPSKGKVHSHLDVITKFGIVEVEVCTTE